MAEATAATRVTQLAVGKTVTMPELYFEQDQARLPPTRTSLDQLAAALCELPELRLEM